jgi:hypothetical protein
MEERLWVASFLVVGVGALFYANSDRAFGPKSQGFILNGAIGNLIIDTTKPIDPAKPISTIAIVVAAIVNSGNTQTIAPYFRLAIKTKETHTKGTLLGFPKHW